MKPNYRYATDKFAHVLPEYYFQKRSIFIVIINCGRQLKHFLTAALLSDCLKMDAT